MTQLMWSVAWWFSTPSLTPSFSSMGNSHPALDLVRSSFFLVFIFILFFFSSTPLTRLAISSKKGTQEFPYSSIDEVLNGFCGIGDNPYPNAFTLSPGFWLHVASSSEPYYGNLVLTDENQVKCGGVSLISEDGRVIVPAGSRPTITSNFDGPAIELAQSNSIDGCILAESTFGVHGFFFFLFLSLFFFFFFFLFFSKLY